MKNHKKNIHFYIVIILLLTQNLIKAQNANWELAQKWSPDNILKKISSSMIRPNWINGTNLFWYIYSTPEGNKYWLVNPSKRSKSPLFNAKLLTKLLNRDAKASINHKKIYLKNMKVLKSGKFLSFDYKQYTYLFNVKRGELTKNEKIEDKYLNSSQNISPDKKLGIFQKGNNLYLSFLDREAKDRQLTEDGKKGLNWGTSSEMTENTDKKKRMVEGLWSPDSKKFCVFRMDERKLPDLWLIDHLAKPLPKLNTYKVTVPGGNVTQWELWIVDTKKEKIFKVKSERWYDQTMQEFFTDNKWWNKKSDILYFLRRHRNYKKVDLCAVNMDTGSVKAVIEERREGQVYLKPPVLLKGDKKIFWWSQKSGHGHFYQKNLKTGENKALTEGAFNTDSLIGFNKKKGDVFIMCNGKEKKINPYYTFLYKTNINNSKMTLLTPENANHNVSLSPDSKYFVDNFSRADKPSETILRDSKGRMIMRLEKMDISKLTEKGWKAPDIFKVKAADNSTDLWGVMYKPFDFDPKKKYPIITSVYPGRQGEFIPHNFSPVSANSSLAQLGFIVVHFGNRGGCYSRGVKYRDYGQNNFRDYGLADKKAVIEVLARRHSYINLKKVGIYGSSSGGFMATSALLVYPDFFKVGVAGCSPNDPGIYFNIWVERYSGVKEILDQNDKITGWECGAEGNLEIAKNLKGKLLMIYGGKDDNVHPSHLYRMADELIKAKKTFDMFVVPRGGHGLGGWRVKYSLIADYFARHLLNSTRTGADRLF